MECILPGISLIQSGVWFWFRNQLYIYLCQPVKSLLLNSPFSRFLNHLLVWEADGIEISRDASPIAFCDSEICVHQFSLIYLVD